MEFDPYTQWLKIPADRRPPSYYDLLGLPAFESDAGRIRQSVMERSEQVRRYQLGQHSQAAIQLLGEISRAFDTLTTPDRKQRYDRRLAGMATEDSGMETVVAETLRPPVQAPPVQTVMAKLIDEPVAPPVQIPTSPFQPDLVPAAEDVRPSQRRRRLWAIAVPKGTKQSLQFAIIGFCMTFIVTVIGYQTMAARPTMNTAFMYAVAAGAVATIIGYMVPALGLRHTPKALLTAGVSTVVLSAKASWWSVRMGDRALCKSLGDENAILHNFFRVVIVGGVLCGVIAAGWMWPEIRRLVQSKPTPPIDPSVRWVSDIASENSEPTSTVSGEQEPNIPAEPNALPAPLMATPAPASAGAIVQNSLGMLLVSLPPGQFSMGSPATEAGRIGTEHPHAVRISRGFCLAAHEVTQGQFQQVMGSNPSQFSVQKRAAALAGVDAARLPVDSVLWSEAVEFCRRLSARPEEQATGRSYRLPTEAEWEYACRAGGTTAYGCGAHLNSSDANFKSPGFNTTLLRTMVVGSYPPNAFGLFDMHGNVEEWCGDYYDYGYYRTSATVDPRGPTSGLNRVARGGAYLDTAEECRSARRVGRYPGSRVVLSGFRVACDLAK